MANKLLSGKIEFIQYHKPGLLSGDYEVTIEQAFGAANGKIPEQTVFHDTREFTVAGPRFQLTPQDIYAVFPPPGSLGEHANVLPHVIFNRSTLPWERELWSDSQSSPEEGVGSSASWLVLLVFHQDDIESGRVSQPKVMKLGDLQRENFKITEQSLTELKLEDVPSAVLKKLEGIKDQEVTGVENFFALLKEKIGEEQAVQYKLSIRKHALRPWNLDEHLKDSDTEVYTSGMPTFDLGSDQHSDDRVTVIDVERGLLETILPPLADLDYLAHVRQRKTLSVDIDKKYIPILKNNCPLKETRTAAEVFANGDYATFRQALKHGGIRLSARCSILCRANGKTEDKETHELVERLEWVLTNVENKKQYIARADQNEQGASVLNIFTNDAEVGIVVANRLPMSNGLTTVHLVSLEDRFDTNGAFQYGADADFARLVSLKQWSFSCTRPDRTFKEIIKSLDKDTLRLKEPPDVESEMSGMLRKGYVPLRHYLRKGDKTGSWYHSPLLPWRNRERLYGLALDNTVSEKDFPPTPSAHGGWTFKGDDRGQSY